MKKTALIIIAFSIMFIIGMCISYYNTSKFLYDDVSILTIYNDGFKILDFRFAF